MYRALIYIVFLASPAIAEAWQSLSGEAIRDALSERRLTYESAWQDFRASGRTLYNAGQDSWGTWTVRGDQYCSQWPPSDLWACYDVAISADGARIRFTSDGNDVSIGTYKD